MSYSKHSGPQKRSGCVNLVLIGTVVGLCGFGLYSCTKDDEVEDKDVNYVNGGHAYANNHHVPGVGYFHAPVRSWFPRPSNDFEPGRGEFAGGGWNAAPNASSIERSNPDPAAVSRVNSQWRSANPGEVASRKASIASSRSTSRGGFGSFFRSGGS